MLRKAVLIDTNLLVLLIVGATSRTFIAKHKNLYPVFNERHFEILRRYVQSASSVLCTPHILAKTSNLVRQISDPMRSRIMAVLRAFVGDTRELHVSAGTAAQSDVFIRLGLTDAAIVSLNPSNLILLTVDHDLHIAAARVGWEVLNMTPIFHET